MAEAATPIPDSVKAESTSSPSTSQRPASSTVYVNNLNERVKLDVLKQSLAALFGVYGNVLSITAHRNLRMRGQAFIAFDDQDIAAKVIKEVNGFPLYGKPMQLAFAKTPSDSVVIKRTGSSDTPVYQQHKTERLQRKTSIQAQRPAPSHKRKRQGVSSDDEDGGDAAASTTTTTTTKKAIPQMPDEYLPPNPILFIQNLPDADTSPVPREELEALFGQFTGLLDVRTIPNNGSIAFVEYGSAEESARARDALNGTKLGSQKESKDDGARGIRITFARG